MKESYDCTYDQVYIQLDLQAAAKEAFFGI